MMHGGNVWEGGHPEAWLDFSANLRPEGPPAWVTAAMRRALEAVRYYPDRAMTAARRGLAEYAGLPSENILPAPGGVAAIDLALSMRRGRVWIERPTFGEYARRAAAHCRPVANVDARCGPEDTVMLCNPNNPTGVALPRDGVLKRAERIAQRGGELIVDEAFIDYCPECSVRGSVADHLTVVSSLTKILGIPGMRLGYVCASKRNIETMAERALPWSLNAMAAAVAAELPRHMDEIRADVALNASRRERFVSRLAALGACVMPSRASFLLCDFRRDMSMAAIALKAEGILVRTCGSFGLGAQWLRLAVRTDGENDRLIGALERCLGL